jgi:hypothetical protein
MPRPSEIRFSFATVRQPAARQRAIVRGDSGRDGFARGVDGDGVRGAFGVFVRDYHLRELEGGGAHGEQGRAEVAGGMADEEGGFGGREGAGGDYQVAFVFAGFGVEDDDGVAAGWGDVLVWGIRVVWRRSADEPNASMASGMVLKAGLEVPFGCWWDGDIVGDCLVVFFSKVSRLTLQYSSMYVSSGQWRGMVSEHSLP